MANIASIKVRKTNTVYGIQDAAASLAIEQMKNGTDIDSFGDVETALNGKSDFFTLSGKLEWDEDMVTHEKILHGSYTPTVTADNENPVTSKGVYNFAFPRDEQRVLGVHNILDPDFNPPSFSGVNDIVTLNNGILTLNGTRSSSANYAIKDRKTGAKVIYLPKGTYTFYALGADWENGVQVGTTYNNAFVSIAQSGSAKDRVTFTVDDNTQSDYKLADGSVLIGLYVKILLGTYSNKIIKPMLCLASDTDDTYTPYAMTNRELTEKVQGIINAATNAADFAAFKTAIGNL